MSAEELNSNILIEGFDPSKLAREEEHYDKGWKQVYGAYQNRTVLQAPMVAIEEVLGKTCAIVQVENVRGMIPLEYFGVENKRELRGMTGKKVAFTVLNYDRENEIFTASRLDALERMAEITLKKIAVDDVIIAVASHVSPSFVRADIGGIEVRIPIEDVKYGWIDDLTEEVNVGAHLKVKVLEIDEENKKVKVSAKAAQENPWNGRVQRYLKGSEYVGTVSGVREYGVFINLESGIDSLSSHLRFQNVEKGDRVLVRVLDINKKEEQIRTRITRIIQKG